MQITCTSLIYLEYYGWTSLMWTQQGQTSVHITLFSGVEKWQQSVPLIEMSLFQSEPQLMFLSSWPAGSTCWSRMYTSIESTSSTASKDTYTHIKKCLLTNLSHKGRMETTVHVGCPPGLSLVFDDVTTQSHDNQFCNPTVNISCFYSGNG